MASVCLHELPEDALRSIFAHVELPHLLKLTCHALRAAGPKRTGIGPKAIAKSVASMRLAHVLRFPLSWSTKFTRLMAEAGNLEGFRWWREMHPNPERPNRGHIPVNLLVLVAATHSGNLALLQWLVDPSTGLHDIGGANMSAEMKDHSPAVSFQAARKGHFHILRWMHSRSYEMNYRTVNAAAEWGDYGMFVWLIGTKDDGATEGVSFDSDVLCHAARGSGLRPEGEHQKLIEHLLRINIGWSVSTFYKSVNTATVEMLQWMKRNGCPDPHPPTTIEIAAENGRRDVLEWLCGAPGTEYQLDTDAAARAAQYGHLALLQWMRARGCPWDYCAPMGAAKPKTMHVFRWMAANGAHIYNVHVNLRALRHNLLQSPAGPLPDQLVPDAMWVHALIRWRKVKLAVLRRGIARYWAQLVES